jgi:hypothetical protein
MTTIVTRASKGAPLSFDEGDANFDNLNNDKAELSGATFTGPVIFSDKLIKATSTPASAAATGTAGQIAWDTSYIYVCTATDTWKRVAISTWP